MQGPEEKEIRNIYRWKKFREYFEQARMEFYREKGTWPRRRHTRLGERLLAELQFPAFSQYLRQKYGARS
jgi:hypothetical protein